MDVEQGQGGRTGLRPRNKAKTYYAEAEEFSADEYMFCDDCQQEFVGGCPTHPYQKWGDVTGILQVSQSTLEGAGRGESCCLLKKKPKTYFLTSQKKTWGGGVFQNLQLGGPAKISELWGGPNQPKHPLPTYDGRDP